MFMAEQRCTLCKTVFSWWGGTGRLFIEDILRRPEPSKEITQGLAGRNNAIPYESRTHRISSKTPCSKYSKARWSCLSTRLPSAPLRYASHPSSGHRVSRDRRLRTPESVACTPIQLLPASARSVPSLTQDKPHEGQGLESSRPCYRRLLTFLNGLSPPAY